MALASSIFDIGYCNSQSNEHAKQACPINLGSTHNCPGLYYFRAQKRLDAILMRSYDTLDDWATNVKHYGYVVKVMSVLPARE